MFEDLQSLVYSRVSINTLPLLEEGSLRDSLDNEYDL